MNIPLFISLRIVAVLISRPLIYMAAWRRQMMSEQSTVVRRRRTPGAASYWLIYCAT